MYFEGVVVAAFTETLEFKYNYYHFISDSITEKSWNFKKNVLVISKKCYHASKDALKCLCTPNSTCSLPKIVKIFTHSCQHKQNYAQCIM